MASERRSRTTSCETRDGCSPAPAARPQAAQRNPARGAAVQASERPPAIGREIRMYEMIEDIASARIAPCDFLRK